MGNAREVYGKIRTDVNPRCADNGELVILSSIPSKVFERVGYTTDSKRAFESLLEVPMSEVLTADELSKRSRGLDPKIRDQLTASYAIIAEIREKLFRRAICTPAGWEIDDLINKLVEEAQSPELITPPKIKIFGAGDNTKFSYDAGSRITTATMNDLPFVEARLRIL